MSYFKNMFKNVLLILFLYCMCSSCAHHPTSNDEVKYEQLAIDFFSDSLMHNPKVFLKNDEEMFLLPNYFDSAWLEHGLFSNCAIMADSIIRKISKPYFSPDALVDDDVMDTDLIARSKEYLEDVTRKEKMNLVVIAIDLPSKINRESGFSISGCSWHLEPKRHIKASDEAIVELSFSHEQEVINLLIFMGNSGEVLGWNFRPKSYPEI